MAVLTQVVRAQTLGLSHRREHSFGAQFQIFRRMAAGTGPFSLLAAGGIDGEQLTQQCRSGLVHAATNRHFDCFQIQRTVLVQNQA
jgi:hypothetical protein